MPFLVLGNKIDVPRAVSEEQLRYALGLQNTFGKEVSASVLIVLILMHASVHTACDVMAAASPGLWRWVLFWLTDRPGPSTHPKP